jgi:phage terminase large subunit-like protein
MTKTIEEDLRQNFEEFFVQAFVYMHPGTELRFDTYLRYVCDVYQHIGERDRILFNQPPRSLKSWSAKIYVTWYLGRNPSKSVMLASNIQSLAELNLEHVKNILRSDWYKKVFPRVKIAKGSSKNRFTTTRHGGVMAVSMQGSLAGFGTDLLVVDDGNKITDALRPDRLQAANDKFDGELYSRLNNKKKGIVIGLQHRLNENDLSGHLIKQDYTVVAFPLIAPFNKKYRFSNGEIWHRKKGDVLTDSYTSNDIRLAKESTTPDFFWFFQQGKGRNEKKQIRIRDFKVHKSKKDDGPFVISIDAAQGDSSGHSFHVIQVWQKLPRSYHLFRQFRAQCSYPAFQSAAKSLIKEFRPCAILIETAANGGALYSVLKNELSSFNVIGIPARGTKEERLDRHRKKIRNGAISLQLFEDWIVDYLLEFDDFPRRGTDVVDATTQMLDYADENPIWYSLPTREPAIAGRRSDGSAIPFVNSTDSGTRGIAIVKAIPFFRRS